MDTSSKGSAATVRSFLLQARTSVVYKMFDILPHLWPVKSFPSQRVDMLNTRMVSVLALVPERLLVQLVM